MKTDNLISLEQLCSNHKIEISFIYSLNECGLIQVIAIDQEEYVDQQIVSEIEKMIRMHYELNINIEGIDTIFNLLKKIEQQQEEINYLTTRLKLYEEQ